MVLLEGMTSWHQLWEQTRMKETRSCPPVKAWLQTCQLEDSIIWAEAMGGGQKSSQSEREPLALALALVTFKQGTLETNLALVGNFRAVHHSINLYTSLF